MRRGLSLIEVLIACIILAIVVSGFILALLSIQTAADESRRQAIVAAFSNLKFAELETWDVDSIYQEYSTPKDEQITDGEGNVLLPDTVTIQIIGEDTDGDGKPDKYYGSPDLACVQIVYKGKVMAERVFGNTDPCNAAEMTPPDIFYADFSAEPTIGVPPLTVQFTDLSSSSISTIVSWSWDFGDGSTSSEQNPSHTYSAFGTYTVTLTITDDRGQTRTCTKQDYIVVSGLTAQFTATPTEGNCPLSVTFTDQSIGEITNWIWDFGDGTTLQMDSSNYQATINHTYDTPGVYTVTLTVQKRDGSGSVENEDQESATITVRAVLTVSADSSDNTSPGEPNPPYGSHSYDPGASVTATCGPNPYYPETGKRYLCTGHNLNGTDGSATSVNLTMNQNHTLTWKWKLQYKLTVTVDDPLGNGSVTKLVNGQVTTAEWFDAGTQVTLVASPADQFRQWTGDATGTTPQITVTMDSAKNITAVFNKFRLTIATDPSGINPAVLDPPRGDNWLPAGSRTIKASLYVNISDGACYRLTSYTGTGAAPSGSVPLSTTTDPYEVTFNLNKDSNLTWKWERFYRVRVSVSPTSGGSVNWNIPSGTQYYTDGGERWFKEGSSISLTAVPNTNYHFVEWQENGTTIGTNATISLNNINSARNITAVFAKDQVTLYVRCKIDGTEVPNNQGLDSPNPNYGDHLYDVGQSLTATIDSSTITENGKRFVFLGWEKQVGTNTTSGSGDSVNLIMNADTTLWWRWKTQYRLQLTVTDGGSVDVTVGGNTTTYSDGTYNLWFEKDEEVTLKANPSGSNQFLGWEGDYPPGQRENQQITITMDEAKTLKASFGIYMVWRDDFNNTSKLSSWTNTEVSSGYLQLATQPTGSWDQQAQVKVGYVVRELVSYTTWCAQSFVPSRSGRLSKIKAYVKSRYSGYYGYGKVEIRAGGPNGTLLATSYRTTIYTYVSWRTFYLRSYPYVRAGQTYTIVWKPYYSYWYTNFYVYGETSNPYQGGSAYRKTSGSPWSPYGDERDYYFRVYIGGRWDNVARLDNRVSALVSYYWPVAQTFKPSITGNITTVKVFLKRYYSYYYSYAYLEIRVGGPAGRRLARSNTVSVPYYAGWVTFSFSNPPSVTAGNTYAIVFRNTSSYYRRRYYAYGRRYNPYNDGRAYWYYPYRRRWYTYSDNRDFAFQIYIEMPGGGNYYPEGNAISVRIPSSDEVVKWDKVSVQANIPSNATITVYVLDGNDSGSNPESTYLKKVTLTSGGQYNIDISDINTEEHPRIKLMAVLKRGSNTTPKIDWWQVTYYVVGN